MGYREFLTCMEHFFPEKPKPVVPESTKPIFDFDMGKAMKGVWMARFGAMNLTGAQPHKMPKKV